MRTSFQKLSLIVALPAALLLSLLVQPGKIQAQRNPPPSMAQVAAASPLPVYVVNEPPAPLPDGFNPGTSWKFTSWTVPNNLSFTATVQKTEGAWAFLTVSGAGGSSRWYYVPYMPGAWEPQ